MIQISLLKAKTHFFSMLRQVKQGKEFYIINKGKILAILASPKRVCQKGSLQAFSNLIALRKKHPIGNVREITGWKKRCHR